MYAFGMVLLELLTAIAPAVPDPLEPNRFTFLANTLRYDVEEVITRLDVAADWDPQIARAIAVLALKCISPDQSVRPKMPFLVTELRKLDNGVVDRIELSYTFLR